MNGDTIEGGAASAAPLSSFLGALEIALDELNDKLATRCEDLRAENQALLERIDFLTNVSTETRIAALAQGIEYQKQIVAHLRDREKRLRFCLCGEEHPNIVRVIRTCPNQLGVDGDVYNHTLEEPK